MDPRRILVLAPHPDDEIVACGIAISRARAADARVFVLYLTTGIPAPEALWAWQRAGYAERLSLRRAEAHAAAALLHQAAARAAALCQTGSRSSTSTSAQRGTQAST